jgi:hypothetical protein
MYQKSSVYTPQISRQAAFVLRRIAWGLGTPMTKALNHAVLALVPKLNHAVVCAACKDQRCSVCPLASYGSRVQLVASDSCVDTYGG